MLKFNYSILLYLLIILFSCSQENIEKKPQAIQDDPANVVLNRIISSGFNKKDIVELSDRYIVEGDIIFYKNESAATTVKPGFNQRVEQARTPYIIDENNLNVKIYLNRASFSTIDLNSALNDVISEYNNINSRLKLARVNSWAEADIEIVQGLAESGQCSFGTFPLGDGKPGKQVIISQLILTSNGITRPDQLKLILAHELGHTLGLHHTDWRTQGESATDIPGTPTSDAASVMNVLYCGSFWHGFSAADVLALKTLYPFPFKDRLYPDEHLNPDTQIQSLDGRFILRMQGDGNLVIYKIINGGADPIWSTKTTRYPGGYVNMQSDGNLVIYQNGVGRWSSNTAGYWGSILIMQNDGNLVIYQNGVPRWSSETWMYN